MHSKEIASLEKIAARPCANAAALAEPNPELLQQSVDFLASEEAQLTMARNSYWPKWNGPWWHMMVLHELGLTELIPKQRIQQVVDAFENYYLQYFPLKLEEVPEGTDPVNQVICHCQMGCTDLVLSAFGLDFEQTFPWARKWYQKYQLADGGLNCDEAVYTKGQPKSSIVSTLPVLEAVLRSAPATGLGNDEGQFLERGAEYLIKRKLFRSATTGAIMNESWADLCFPRFYYYDLLRGLTFLLNWSARFDRAIPATAIIESMELIDSKSSDGIITLGRVSWRDSFTREWDDQSKSWVRRPEYSYPLLDSLSITGQASKALTAEWNQAKTTLGELLNRNLIQP